MDNKKLNLASHWAELGASFQKICLKEIHFRDLMVIKKGWNPARKFGILEGRASRTRENQATIQGKEEQLNQTGHTQIPSGSQGVDQTSSPVASHHSGTNISVAKSYHSSQSQGVSRRRQGYKGKNKTTFNQRKRELDPMIQKLLDLVKEKTMSFENYKYSVNKDPYEWCFRQSKRLKAIDPQMNIQIRNHKLLRKMPGEREHAVKFRCKHMFTLYNIANTLQHIRKRTNIGKYSPYKRSRFKERQPFRVDFKHKPRERVAEVTKKKNSCHNWGSTDH
ncbi:hypothetical protein O181_025130 [Austropuccinia psidii MF-1]|uniref:Uncharacterized protein n=1 Tax=Austropuccinia psidii MF-1 TaxID=1389203 RepID=A0A9Q3CM20_9BASI|nr:hypothetical protein [Austropuccinia psidii MF-1]